MNTLLAFLFLFYAAYLTIAERVAQRFQKGLISEELHVPAYHLDTLQKGNRLSMTFMVASLTANLGFVYCMVMAGGAELLSPRQAAFNFAVAFLVLLLFAKWLPRVFVARFNQVSFRMVIYTLPFLISPFYILSVPLLSLSRKMTLVHGVQNDDEFFGSVTETEIMHSVNAAAKAGTLELHEKEMIRSVIELSDTIAREVMVPRTKIVSIEEGTPLKEVLKIISNSGFTRLPIFKENIDHVIGILYAKDLLRYFDSDTDQPDLTASLMHEPVFVPETKKVVELLSDFNRSRTHIAIVVDEYGGTAGLITVEDILEEIVGEIHDEYDMPGQPPILKVDEKTWVVLGQTPIYEIRDLVKINIEEKEDFDSIAGFISDAMGKIPQTGEKFEQSGISFTILEADERRILKVKLELIETPSEATS